MYSFDETAAKTNAWMRPPEPSVRTAQRQDKPIVQIVISEEANYIPCYAHAGDAGMDLRSTAPDFTMLLGDIVRVPTGIKVVIPDGYVGLVTPRSGLSSQGITVANSPGVIDSGFRGEIQVLLASDCDTKFVVTRGDRIAQLLIVPVATAELEFVTELPKTSRGENGFGSTGVK